MSFLSIFHKQINSDPNMRFVRANYMDRYIISHKAVSEKAEFNMTELFKTKFEK